MQLLARFPFDRAGIGLQRLNFVSKLFVVRVELRDILAQFFHFFLCAAHGQIAGTVALPMVQDFGWTKEIEDRLLAPISTRLVAAEKIVSGMIQGLISAAFVLPIARLVMGPIPALTLSHAGEVALVVLLGSLAFSAFGMWLGTAIAPQQIGLMFSVIVAPMLFFGCAYYPWRGLDVIPAMKYAVLVNPMVYVSEGMRGALTPGVPHMSLSLVGGALVVIAGAFWIMGIRSFYKRAIG